MIKVKSIKPLFNRILVTAECYDKDVKEGGLVIKTEGTLKEYQKVVAIGTTVKDIQVGDLVLINPTRYAVMKHQEGSLKDGVITDNPVVKYNFHMVYMNDTPYILLYDADVDYIIQDFEDIPEGDIIYSVTPKIIS